MKRHHTNSFAQNILLSLSLKYHGQHTNINTIKSSSEPMKVWNVIKSLPSWPNTSNRVCACVRVRVYVLFKQPNPTKQTVTSVHLCCLSNSIFPFIFVLCYCAMLRTAAVCFRMFLFRFSEPFYIYCNRTRQHIHTGCSSTPDSIRWLLFCSLSFLRVLYPL